jgi:hypothetical protein
MNKSSVKKKRPARASRTAAVRKSPVRAAATRKIASKTASRQPTRKPEPAVTQNLPAAPPATVTVAQVTAIASPLRSHKFRVGQTVSYTSSPISRPGASGSYQVVRLLPSDGDDYQYRIKNPGEAFERVAKESQLELEH